jgi:hypothetical protein
MLMATLLKEDLIHWEMLTIIKLLDRKTKYTIPTKIPLLAQAIWYAIDLLTDLYSLILLFMSYFIFRLRLINIYQSR